MAESWEQGWVKLIFHMYFRLTPEWVFDVSSFSPAARRCKPIRGQVFFCLWNLINNKLREAPHVKPRQCCSISKRPTQAQLLFWIMWSTLAAAWACQQSVSRPAESFCCQTISATIFTLNFPPWKPKLFLFWLFQQMTRRWRQILVQMSFFKQGFENCTSERHKSTRKLK